MTIPAIGWRWGWARDASKSRRIEWDLKVYSTCCFRCIWWVCVKILSPTYRRFLWTRTFSLLLDHNQNHQTLTERILFGEYCFRPKVECSHWFEEVYEESNCCIASFWPLSLLFKLMVLLLWDREVTHLWNSKQLLGSLLVLTEGVGIVEVPLLCSNKPTCKSFKSFGGCRMAGCWCFVFENLQKFVDQQLCQLSFQCLKNYHAAVLFLKHRTSSIFK